MASYTEKFPGQEDRYSGHFDSDRMEKPVSSEIQDMNMTIVDPESARLDSNKGGGTVGFMGKAVAHLNRETQRGEHAPMVGGYVHDHTMR